MSGRSSSASLNSSTLTITDTQGNSQNVVQIEPPGTDTLTLSADVTFGGPLAAFLVGLPITFQVDYLFTPIGPGTGGRFVGSPVSVTTSAGVFTYNAGTTPSTKLVIDTSAASLPPAGVYEVAARVTVPGIPGAPLSAMTDNEIDLEIFS
jgi:hypothetical protein